MKLNFAGVLFMVCLAFEGFANFQSDLQGFKKPSASQEQSITGPLKKFSEVGPHFEVVIEKQAAIYLLPRDKRAPEIRKFLQKASKEKTSYDWDINPMTQQIYQARPSKN